MDKSNLITNNMIKTMKDFANNRNIDQIYGPGIGAESLMVGEKTLQL